jgi:hypothetical protein
MRDPLHTFCAGQLRGIRDGIHQLDNKLTNRGASVRQCTVFLRIYNQDELTRPREVIL